jgi:hypothetical protein
VAEVVKPRRRRRLTAEQRATNAGHLAAWREKSLAQSRISNSEPPLSPPVGPKATPAQLTQVSPLKAASSRQEVEPQACPEAVHLEEHTCDRATRRANSTIRSRRVQVSGLRDGTAARAD